jgi:protein involved in polysaccharide export with SLBB domain
MMPTKTLLSRAAFRALCTALVLSMVGLAPESSAQPQPPGQPAASTAPRAAANQGTGESLPAGPAPFGANLFLGNFLRQRENGVNPDYVVMPGDRVAVYTWGALEVNDVFVVDTQGNIFLPQIGPISLSGVRNADLTATVERAIGRVYARNVGVYTNLLTAAPVAVYVTGGVARPGRYAGVPSDSVLFFLDQAGGVDPSLGSYRNIAVLRAGKLLAEVDLYDFMTQGLMPAIQFADGDTILVRPRGSVVEVKGDVAAPALIELDEDSFTGADVLAIIPMAARATEVTLMGVRKSRPFTRTMTVDELRTAQLQHGDVVELRDDGHADTILVHLEGEFDGPTILSVTRDARLVDVLNYVKVDPEMVDVRSIHLRRSSVARAQKKTIDDSLFRLEQSALLALSSTNVEADIRLKEAELMRQFIASARLIQPLGRVVTSRKGSLINVRLEEDDVIVLPRKNHVIRVGGEVQMTQALIYDPALRARDYVRQSGGHSNRADRDRIIILHADASVSMGDLDSRVRPGDEILVPPKVDSKLLQNTMDITSVIYQIAVAAAVVLAI